MEEEKNLILYTTTKKDIKIPVKLDKETVWLSQKQMALLFDTSIDNIGLHLKNIFRKKELDKNSVTEESSATASDGKQYKTNFYNLDAIISVGYRVNSVNGTKFRIWATRVLRDHILKGFTINQKRLKENSELKLTELEKAIKLLKHVSDTKKLKSGEAKGLLKVITEYANSWILLQKYDEHQLKLESSKTKHRLFNYQEANTNILELKKNLTNKKQATDIFGKERGESLQGIIGNLGQSFSGKELYPSIEIKAAHLLYFVIKDHPFVDGNKRIASFLFVTFLAKNNFLLDKKREKKINDNTLVALALLVAESDPKEKDTLIILITNLLKN